MQEEEEGEKKQETRCPQFAYFDRVLPVSGQFPCLSHSLRKLDLFTYSDPGSAHTRIWPSSHSGVQVGGEINFSPICKEFNRSIQRMPFHYTARGHVSKTFQWVGWPAAPILPASQTLLLVNNRARRTLRQAGFGCTGNSPVARNVKCFPRKFLLLQESREGNQENFDTFQAVGVSMKKGVRVLIGLLRTKCANCTAEESEAKLGLGLIWGWNKWGTILVINFNKVWNAYSSKFALIENKWPITKTFAHMPVKNSNSYNSTIYFRMVAVKR